MKVMWIHGVSRLRGASMNKCVDFLQPAVGRQATDFDIVIDEIKGIRVPFLKGIINRYFLYSIHSLKLRADLFHIHDHANAHLISLLPKNAPKILTLYDLYMLEIPVLNPKVLPFRLFNVPGIRRADHIITISSQMKKEISEKLSYPTERISVIYSGIDHSLYTPRPGCEEVLRQYGLESGTKYLLFVGSEIPRKNFNSVLIVFKRLLESHPDLVLLKVGNPGSQRARNNTMRKMTQLELQDKALFCGFVPEEHLPYFYSNAQLLLAPSHYEGDCGLHVIEAMACGCPVVASNIPQARELAGDAVIYCDPNNVDDILEKTISILEDEKVRAELVSKGPKKAREFSWEKSAKEHISLYIKYME